MALVTDLVDDLNWTTQAGFDSLVFLDRISRTTSTFTAFVDLDELLLTILSHLKDSNGRVLQRQWKARSHHLRRFDKTSW
jgi:hypothetical protein